MRNLYRQFLDLIPSPSLNVGEVIAVDGGVATIELPGGGQLQARGTATVGQQVFFRDGVIEGTAPSLMVEIIEV
jgi:hypothetical protein